MWTIEHWQTVDLHFRRQQKIGWENLSQQLFLPQKTAVLRFFVMDLIVKGLWPQIRSEYFIRNTKNMIALSDSSSVNPQMKYDLHFCMQLLLYRSHSLWYNIINSVNSKWQRPVEDLFVNVYLLVTREVIRPSSAWALARTSLTINCYSSSPVESAAAEAEWLLMQAFTAITFRRNSSTLMSVTASCAGGKTSHSWESSGYISPSCRNAFQGLAANQIDVTENEPKWCGSYLVSFIGGPKSIHEQRKGT
jgi:hypothetical protein